MNIRQEESTPIGDYFHDADISKIFDKLKDSVDEFEVETDDVNAYCDALIDSLKGLKTHVKKVESAWAKRKSQQKITETLNIGIDV